MNKPEWMPFYVSRFLSSATVLRMSHVGGFAYALLLMHAWHQEPAGTLPDDDGTLVAWARLKPAQWRKVREEVLRAFEMRGGRWHQPFMADRVAPKSYAKLEQSREAARASVASRSGNVRTNARTSARSSGRLCDRSPRPVVVLPSDGIQNQETENNNTAGSTGVATPAQAISERPLTFEPDDTAQMDPRLETLLGVGISFGVAQKLIREHNTPAALLAEYAEMSLESTVQNRAAFVRAAMAGSYAPRKTNVARVSVDDVKAMADAEAGLADGLARAAKLKTRVK